MGSDSIPQKLFRMRVETEIEFMHICIPSQGLKKDPDIHVLDRRMLATKTHPACTIQEDRMWLPQWLG